MSVLALIRPYPIAAVGGNMTGASRLITPDPKEAAISVGGTQTIDIDLGASRSIDTLFLGYLGPGTTVGDTFTVQYGVAAYDESTATGIMVAASDLLTPVKHAVRIYDAPFSARYIRLSKGMGAGSPIGVFAASLAIRPQYGHEFGAGRTVTDTGTAERLQGGGFGINPGAIVGGWRFTLGDLQPAELTAMWALMRDRGQTKSLLIIEDPDQAGSLSDRCHWGLMTKLEAYERIDPMNTRWNLEIGDWS